MSKFSYKVGSLTGMLCDLTRIPSQFSNLCGAVYKRGNVEFTKDGNGVFSPVGNRISLFDLKKQVSVGTERAFLKRKLHNLINSW